MRVCEVKFVNTPEKWDRPKQSPAKQTENWRRPLVNSHSQTQFLRIRISGQMPYETFCFTRNRFDVFIIMSETWKSSAGGLVCTNHDVALHRRKRKEKSILYLCEYRFETSSRFSHEITEIGEMNEINQAVENDARLDFSVLRATDAISMWTYASFNFSFSSRFCLECMWWKILIVYITQSNCRLAHTRSRPVTVYSKRNPEESEKCQKIFYAVCIFVVDWLHTFLLHTFNI